jgi:hypothetical protein
MSGRPKKKPSPVVGAVAPQITDRDDLHCRTDKVHDLWREAGFTIARDPLSWDQAESLAWEITCCVPVPPNPEKEKQDAGARAAIRTLLAWCRYDPNDNGLPHVVFRDHGVEALEMALLRVQPLAEAPASRPWVNRAWHIWRQIALIRRATGKETSISAGSHAVLFVSLALQWVGFPATTVTIDAISKEFRNDPESQKRALE